MMRSTTRRLVALFALLGATRNGVATAQSTDGESEQLTRTFITVEFNYQLEVNASSTDLSVDSGTVLHNIDANIIASLQEGLPNGYTPDDQSLPNVKYNAINSTVITMCFTESDSCQLIKSEIGLSYAGVKPDHSVERVTINLVQDYLQSFNKANRFVRATYTYPVIVSGRGQFQIQPVTTPMNGTEIEILERSFMDVFGAIVFALDGDTAIDQVLFVYQAINERVSNHTVDENETEVFNTLSTVVEYFGNCRSCSDDQFSEQVDEIILSALQAFQDKLQTNGQAANNDYFDRIKTVSYSVPQMPNSLPPIGDSSLFDSQPPQTSTPTPWYVYFSVFMAVAVIVVGVYLVWRDQKRMHGKEDVSTGESESNDENNENDGDDNDNDEEEGGGEMIEHIPTTMNDTPTIVSNVEETTDKGAENKNYEVYVY